MNVIILLLLLHLNLGLKPDYIGLPTYYSEGVMEKVLDRRIHWGHIKKEQLIPDCLSALNYDYIGDYILVKHKDNSEVCLVVDVANINDREKREKNNLIVEVDYNSAKRLGIEIGNISEAEVFILKDKGGKGNDD
jgi:hypothetical protein